MDAKNPLATLLSQYRSLNDWYKENRDVGAPALFAFRDLISDVIRARTEESVSKKFGAIQVSGDPQRVEVYTDLRDRITDLADALVPLLSRILIERKGLKDEGAGQVRTIRDLSR